ncbi:MAG: adenine phosphoribosyltransferase [Bacteroidales bacterium]
MNTELVKSVIRDIPDFPVKGVIFKDITTILQDKVAFAEVANEMKTVYSNLGITKVVGIESRGFIYGAILAKDIDAGFVPIRKPGKLPAETISKSYAKEYGVDTIEIHKDAITEDDVVLIHDDILATGGTILAAYELVKDMNPKTIYINFIAELEFLKGRELLPADVDVKALITF